MKLRYGYLALALAAAFLRDWRIIALVVSSLAAVGSALLGECWWEVLLSTGVERTTVVAALFRESRSTDLNVLKQVVISSLMSICWRTTSMNQGYSIIHSALCFCYLSDGFTIAFLVDWQRITLCVSGRTAVGLAFFCTLGRVTLVGTGVERTSI